MPLRLVPSHPPIERGRAFPATYVREKQTVPSSSSRAIAGEQGRAIEINREETSAYGKGPPLVGLPKTNCISHPLAFKFKNSEIWHRSVACSLGVAVRMNGVD